MVRPLEIPVKGSICVGFELLVKIEEIAPEFRKLILDKGIRKMWLGSGHIHVHSQVFSCRDSRTLCPVITCSNLVSREKQPGRFCPRSLVVAGWLSCWTGSELSLGSGSVASNVFWTLG